MTKNRFEELSCYLHFSDSSKEPACGDTNYGRLFKVRAVLYYVGNKRENNFKPTKNIAIGEGMIGFRVDYLFDSTCQPSRLSMELKFVWPLIVVMAMC